MDTLFSIHWFSGQLVQAIYWTLVHSLWIGLLTAVVTGGVMMATQKSTSRLRYQLLSYTLLAFVLVMAVVFYREMVTTSPQQAGGGRLVQSVSAEQAMFYQRPVVADGVGFVDRLITFLKTQSSLLFGVWLLFFVLKSLKLVGGLYYVHRIRYRRVLAVDQRWQARLDSFRRTLGISQPVRLLQSALVSVPVTVGLFKPVILVPVGLFLQLSPEQIDTILWHELAHIWRRDYLVNSLQCLVETVFFFNPGLLWLSSLIRDEREVCCDDVVLAQGSGKSHYVEALLAFQLNAHTDSALVMGLRSHKLVNRLKRMVTEENQRLSLVEKVALLAGLIVFSAFTLLPPPVKEVSSQRISVTKAVFPGVQPPVLIRKNVQTPVTQSAVKRTRPHAVADTLPANSPKLGQSALANRHFTSILFVTTNQDMANREMTALDDTGTRYRLRVANSQLVALEVNGTPVAESALNQYQNLLPQLDEALLTKSRAKHEELAQKTAAFDATQQQQRQEQKEAQERKLANRQPNTLPEKPSKKGGDNQASKKESQAAYSTVKKKWQAATKADTVAEMQSWKMKKRPESPDVSSDQQRVRGVIAVLVQHKIVPDPSAVDGFGLSESELVVNGVRQSAELHQQLKTQYGIKPDYGLFYGSSGGKGIILEKSDL